MIWVCLLVAREAGADMRRIPLGSDAEIEGNGNA